MPGTSSTRSRPVVERELELVLGIGVTDGWTTGHDRRSSFRQQADHQIAANEPGNIFTLPLRRAKPGQGGRKRFEQRGNNQQRHAEPRWARAAGYFNRSRT